MEYSIENEYLKVTVTTWGAQVKSVVRKCDGVEHIWQADKSVWGYHAPILFPHAGKVVDGKIEAKGRVYESGQHGFARLMEHDFVEQTADTIVLELCSSEETLSRFPYEFRLVSTFTLENDTLHHTLTVENLDEEKLPFGIGYHPAFTVPFDDKHVATDYELRFSGMESPICINNLPYGLVHGDIYHLPANIQSLAVDDQLFANDSHCMVNLKSQTLGLASLPFKTKDYSFLCYLNRGTATSESGKSFSKESSKAFRLQFAFKPASLLLRVRTCSVQLGCLTT